MRVSREEVSVEGVCRIAVGAVHIWVEGAIHYPFRPLDPQTLCLCRLCRGWIGSVALSVISWCKVLYRVDGNEEKKRALRN